MSDSFQAAMTRSAEIERRIGTEPGEFRMLTGDRPTGALHHWRAWTLSLVAAAGGMAGAAFAFLAFVTWRDQVVLAQAWPVAAAVDIAAGTSRLPQ